MPKLQTYFATCARGIEAVLADELRALGAGDIKTENGGVAFSGWQALLYRANLELRSATRILLPLSEFPATNADELYQGVRNIDWTEYLDSQKTLAVHSKIRGKSEQPQQPRRRRPPEGRRAEEGLIHSHFVSLKIKDAIVDQLRASQGGRPNVRLARPDVSVSALLLGERCILSLNATGESLHQRGYRSGDSGAPLKETLAAALIALTGWDGSTPFIDPMCGSGTLVIEAGLKALNVAPGLEREHFGFFGWPDFCKELWDEVKEDVRSKMRREVDVPIVGYDLERKAIADALKNAEGAGLAKHIHFERRAIDGLAPVGKAPGVLLVNPPYGQRLGAEEKLKDLYMQLGDLFKQKMQGWRCYIFTGNRELAKSVGLRTSRRIPLYNGPLECRLLEYEMY